MGCFLACFGLKTKKKGRKSRNISSSVERNHGSYLPLDSDVLFKLDTTEKHTALDSEIKEKPKEVSRSRIKKKVRFNLNVEAYEPIQNDDEDDINTESEEEEETKWEFNKETTSLMATLHHAQDSVSSGVKSYPQNHRYHNCSIEEIYEDEDDDDYELENDSSGDQEKGDNYDSDQNDEKNSIIRQNLGLKNEEVEGIGSALYAKDRRKYVLSVLSPVENLSQWKAMKVKVASAGREKENALFEKNTPSHHLKEEQSFDSCYFKKKKDSKVFRDDGVAVDAAVSQLVKFDIKRHFVH